MIIIQGEIWIYIECPRRKGQYSGSHLNANLKIVDKKEILGIRTVSNAGIYFQVTELVQFIINDRKFHRQHQCTLQLL